MVHPFVARSFYIFWIVRALKPTLDGIVERNHRTVKSMASRCKMNPLECVFFYNSTPKSSDNVTPSSIFFSRDFRFPFEKSAYKPSCPEDDSKSFEIGDKVFVKPHPTSCTSKWKTGTVTKLNVTILRLITFHGTLRMFVIERLIQTSVL